MSEIDLFDLPAGSQIRITDIEGHHTTIITTAQTTRENDNSVCCIHVITDEPGFDTTTGILPTGRMADRFITTDTPYYIESFGGRTCDMIVWSASVAT